MRSLPSPRRGIGAVLAGVAIGTLATLVAFMAEPNAAFGGTRHAPAPASSADTLQGQVLSVEDDSPVTGAVLQIVFAAEGRTVRTDASGRYRFETVPPGRHTLEVRAPGFEPRSLTVTVPETGTGTVDVWLTPEAEPAQAERQEATLVGTVTASTSGAPLADVAVRIEGTGIGVFTDSAGRYRLTGVPPGPAVLRAERIGYATRRIHLNVPGTGTVQRDVTLGEQAIAMEGITVTTDAVSRAEGELGTASVIDRPAIEHQTAVSLGGILELVPGVELSPPGLAGVQQVALRTTRAPIFNTGRGAPSAADLASFGTLIILDGVPVSNNANLQASDPRGGGLSFTTSAGGGVDLGQIPASTIERVEVIRGVPSARWGDLTQGAVVVETRAGEVEPELKAQYDARTLETSAVGGASLGSGGHTGSLTFDFARTRERPGVADDYAYRAAGQLAHRWESGLVETRSGQAPRLMLDGRVDFYQLFEDLPEDANIRPGRSSWSRDRGLRISERLRWQLDPKTRFSGIGSFTGVWQRSHSQQPATFPAMPFTDRLTEGREEGFFVQGQYLAELDVHGLQSMAYGRFELEHERELFGARHHLRVGSELRREGNAGEGRQFDIQRPPVLTFDGIHGYDRPRSFEQIPSLATTAFYVDDRLRKSWGDVLLQAQAGVRLDLLHEGSTWFSGARDALLQPRLNVELSPVPWLRLRGGAGRMAKTPTLGQLYPAPQYYDLVNVNQFTDDPEERYAVLTTFIEDPTNSDLGLVTADKMEVGFEIGSGGWAVSLVAFEDRILDGVGIRHEPTHVLREHFPLTDSVIGNGEKPEIIPPAMSADTVPVLVDRPAHKVDQTSRGLELVATLPELEPVHTRLQVTGSWVRTNQAVEGLLFGIGDSFRNFQQQDHVQRHPYWRDAEFRGESAMLAYRLIHQQPEAGLVITATIQHNVHDEIADLTGTDTLAFEGYVTRAGELVSVPRAERGDPEYVDLRFPRASFLIQPRATPADWMMNLKVSKTLPLDGKLNFWAFNLLDRRGIFRDINVQRRIYPPMRFGLEVTLPARALWPWSGGGGR